MPDDASQIDIGSKIVIDRDRPGEFEPVLPLSIRPPSTECGKTAGETLTVPVEDMTNRVKSYLAQRGVPALRRLIVECAGETIILRGLVRSYYEKQLAVHCCQRVAGVRHVVDAIDVGQPGGGCAPMR